MEKVKKKERKEKGKKMKKKKKKKKRVSASVQNIEWPYVVEICGMGVSLFRNLEEVGIMYGF